MANPKIAFGVLKINRVDFVRHGARANLARFQTLFEITQGHIAPYMSRDQSIKYGVGARNRIKQLSHVVMRFDLNAVRLKTTRPKPNSVLRMHVPLYALAFRQQIWLNASQSNSGQALKVGVVVAYCAVHLGQ